MMLSAADWVVVLGFVAVVWLVVRWTFGGSGPGPIRVARRVYAHQGDCSEPWHALPCRICGGGGDC